MKHSSALALSAWLALALVVACEPAPTAVPTAPRFAISDGAHAGGNAGFYWLPPIVPPPSPTPSGTFDGTRSPVVSICAWDGTACTAPVAEYTMETGPGSETVRVVPEDEHYIVNWHTDEPPLDPSLLYRIEASVDGFVLGTADVEVGSTGGELRSVDADLWVALVDGKTLAIKFRIEEGAMPSEPPPPPSHSQSSVALDGADDVVDMGNGYNLEGNEGFSLSIWFKTSTIGAEQHLIGRQNPGSLRKGYFMHLDAMGNVCFSKVVNENSLMVRRCTATPPEHGVWHHVVATNAGGTEITFLLMKLYVDGVEVADYQNIGFPLGANSIVNSGGNFTVGAALCSPGAGSCSETPLAFPFQGHVDEDAVFLVELTGEQVAELYNGGAPTDLLAQPPDPNSWWRMGECTDAAMTLVCDEGAGAVVVGVLNFYPGTLRNGAAFSTDVPSP